MHAHGSGTGWERGFWFVFNCSTNPMCLIDEERRIVEVNDSILAMLERSRAELIGSPAVDFIAPMDRAESETRWQSILQTESGEFHGTGTLVLGDGSELELDYAARMVRISGRRLAIYVMLWERKVSAPWGPRQVRRGRSRGGSERSSPRSRWDTRPLR